MKMLLNADRIRSILDDCKTEPDIMRALRAHRIRYAFTTETGYMSIRIPYRKGIIRVFRTCSRSRPFIVRTETEAPYNRVPCLNNDY